jgi:hypothetical protein
MAASKYDFDIEKGSSFRISIIYKDSEGTPVDLTNWCARLVWKTNLNITQSFSTENLDSSVYKFFIDGPDAKITLMIPSNTTNSFTFRNAKYDLELQSPDDLYAGGGKFTTRILFGVINLVQRYSGTENSLDCQNE